jgi:RHS repeat-associated protein
VNAGTAYDAFGRTTTQASGATIAYYTNDLVRQQTSADGNSRQTWTLDAAQRLAAWTTETSNAGTWTQTGSKVNHYGSDDDSPDWIKEDATGTITRNVQGSSGDLDATTDSTGSTVLQLTDLHGDVTVQLPLDNTKPVVASAYDEYGNPEAGTTATRYGWLGGKQRSSETVTGATLMGVRLYDSTAGRFLSTDPVPGGSANAYDYVSQDPLNTTDLDGRCFWDGCVMEGYGAYLLGAAAVGGAYYLYRHPVHVRWHLSWHWHFFKKKKNATNSGKRYKSRSGAEKAARKDAKSGGRCRFRGPCRKGNHVHVDYYNKWGEISHTRHYEWPWLK